MKNIYESHINLNDLYSVNFLSKILNNMSLTIPDGNLPEQEFLSKIESIIDKNNPIIFILENGNKLFFTYPEYRRLHGKPEIGKTIKYSFQKIPFVNRKDETYMIKKCIIF